MRTGGERATQPSGRRPNRPDVESSVLDRRRARRELSRACSLSDFAPRRLGEIVARFTGPEGPGLLDVAKDSGRNLHDPKRRARPGEDYFFRNAGTRSCEVLVGGRERGGGVVRPASR